MQIDVRRLNELSRELRIDLLQMIYRAKSCHLGVALSEIEILVSLYFGGILQIDPNRPDWPDRDRFILSKGHGCSAYYLVLAKRGFFPEDEVKKRFCTDGSRFIAQLNHYAMPGIELSTGALGHGLSAGMAMAMTAKSARRNHRVFVLLGDGELNEGSCWEAIMQSAHHGMDNLVGIVDRNGLQAYGLTEEVVKLEPLREKWSAFNWAVKVVDGHDVGQLVEALSAVPFEVGKPSVVIANTVKGKGVSFMEHQVKWHYLTPSAEDLRAAVKELGGDDR